MATKKEYDGKINTVKDAKKLLNEIIPVWESSGDESKIISLGRFAEKWQTSPDKGDKEKMKILFTSINQTKAQIKRDEALGESTAADKNKLKNYQTQLADLEATYGKYVPVKAKKKEKPVIE